MQGVPLNASRKLVQFFFLSKRGEATANIVILKTVTKFSQCILHSVSVRGFVTTGFMKDPG